MLTRAWNWTLQLHLATLYHLLKFILGRTVWAHAVHEDVRTRERAQSPEADPAEGSALMWTNRSWAFELMEDKHVYLGRCHSHAWSEPWLQLAALSSTTRPTVVMQLPCIKSRLPCNLKKENKACALVSSTVQQFDLFSYLIYQPQN